VPIYDYDCLECGRRIEVVHGVHAPGPSHCPNCGGGPLRKAISAPAVHFKGSGWAKKERRATVAPGASETGDASTEGGEGKKGEDKVAAGTDKAEGATAPQKTAETSGKTASPEKRAAAASGTAGSSPANKTD
jgi:putative FmdB family regulatory protein